MSTTTLGVACQGFGEHEQGLLQQQLKMLRGRTALEWSYLPQPADAQLVFVREANQPQGSATAVFKDGRFTLRKQVEWPLRIVGLYDLLSDCERDLPIASAAPSVSLPARLAGLTSATFYMHEALRFVILPHEDRLFSDIPEFETLLATLQNLPADLLPAPLSAAPGMDVLRQAYSLKRVVWALSLHEPIAAARLADMSATEYRIGAWPDYGEWESSPALLRLAALYSRQFATVQEGADFSRATPEEVVAFLDGCDRCGLAVTSRAKEAAVPAPSRPERIQDEGLLSRLRKRLGMAFGISS
ncbi:hypothetical protein [Pseudomonas sp. Marseille-QA0892]